MNTGVYDGEAEGMKALQQRRPWEWPYESEGYTRQDAAYDAAKEDDDGDIVISRLSRQKEWPA